MTQSAEPIHDYMSKINNRLEAERVAAGDFLFGLIDAIRLAKRCKEEGLDRGNIPIFLLEQAGAQPLITTNLGLQAQKDGIKKLGELACNRFFQRSILSHVYLHADPKFTKWLTSAAEILAKDVPSAFLKVIEFNPDSYMKSDARDIAIKDFFIDSLSEESRLNVASEARDKRKLPMLLKKTGWGACKSLMKTGNNRRILLTIEMGL